MRSCKVFLFIMSDTKLVQIIDAAHLPPQFYLLLLSFWWEREGGLLGVEGGTIHTAVAFALFFLILLKSGPTTDDETFFLPFSGSLWNRFLIFSRQGVEEGGNVRSSSSWCSASWVSRGENRSLKKYIIHLLLSVRQKHRRMKKKKWGSSRMWDPPDSAAVDSPPFLLLSFTTQPLTKYNQHAGLSPLFSEAPWWRNSCPILS